VSLKAAKHWVRRLKSIKALPTIKQWPDLCTMMLLPSRCTHYCISLESITRATYSKKNVQISRSKIFLKHFETLITWTLEYLCRYTTPLMWRTVVFCYVAPANFDRHFWLSINQWRSLQKHYFCEIPHSFHPSYHQRWLENSQNIPQEPNLGCQQMWQLNDILLAGVSWHQQYHFELNLQLKGEMN